MRASATEMTGKSLLEAVEASDVDRALEMCVKMVNQGVDPWEIHLSLFPTVQRVTESCLSSIHIYPRCTVFIGNLCPT